MSMSYERARLIAYHDEVCDPNCGEDPMVYPTPPNNWWPDERVCLEVDPHMPHSWTVKERGYDHVHICKGMEPS